MFSKVGTYAIETNRKVFAASWEHESAREETHVNKAVRGFVLGPIDLTNIQRLVVLILLSKFGQVVFLVLPLGVKAGIEMDEDVLSFVHRILILQPFP